MLGDIESKSLKNAQAKFYLNSQLRPNIKRHPRSAERQSADFQSIVNQLTANGPNKPTDQIVQWANFNFFNFDCLEKNLD